MFAVGLFLIWQFAGAIVLIFAACLVAIVLKSISGLVSRLLRLPHAISLPVSLIAIAGAFSGVVLLLGLRVQSDFSYLWQQVPVYLNREFGNLGIDFSFEDVFDEITGTGGWAGLLGGLANYTVATVSLATTTVLVIAGGIFLAARPDTYVEILVRLMPKDQEDRVRSVLTNLGNALENWLFGQFALMIGIGVTTTIGLMIIGLPSALGLGLLAGLLEFIPVAGPIAAAVPAILVALSVGYVDAMWTAALYLVIQQVESAVFVPLVQRRAVSLPPALGLFSIVVFGIWFGPLGIILSAPLAVCVHLLVVQLYSRDRLGWDVEIPGAKNPG
ncbi:AI-2E family transporter [Cucumibacter marinus]|uniref:AI-2E family transporter n=1 Tax=Cucumibacter marinus TaxID=1121252 RepID=UPI00247FB3B6|nr:AI-2E family transporter [Cucumibacter marinus]